MIAALLATLFAAAAATPAAAPAAPMAAAPAPAAGCLPATPLAGPGIADPFHAPLQFKEVRPGIWSVRIGLHWRALARRNGEDLQWFWIGSHADYDAIIR